MGYVICASRLYVETMIRTSIEFIRGYLPLVTAIHEAMLKHPLFVTKRKARCLLKGGLATIAKNCWVLRRGPAAFRDRTLGHAAISAENFKPRRPSSARILRCYRAVSRVHGQHCRRCLRRLRGRPPHVAGPSPVSLPPVCNARTRIAWPVRASGALRLPQTRFERRSDT